MGYAGPKRVKETCIKLGMELPGTPVQKREEKEKREGSREKKRKRKEREGERRRERESIELIANQTKYGTGIVWK